LKPHEKIVIFDDLAKLSNSLNIGGVMGNNQDRQLFTGARCLGVVAFTLLVTACGGGGGGGSSITPPPPATYTVTYNGNANTGGSVPVDSSTYQQGASVTVLGNTGSLVKTGSSFTNWNTVSNGTGTAYTQGQTLTMGTANVTLYAQWTANTVAGYAYAVNYNGGSSAGSISQYTIGPNGALTPMATPSVSTGGNDPRYITVDPLGKYVYASNIKSNTVAQFTIGADGSLTPMSTPTVATGSYPEGSAVHPTGKWFYVANEQSYTVSQYTIGTDGRLSAMTPATVNSGTGAWPFAADAVAIDPSGKYAYVTNFNSTISQYNINQTTGALSAMTPATVDTGGYNPAEIKIVSIPSGTYVYAANYGGNGAGSNNIAQYRIQTDGTLSSIGSVSLTPSVYSLSIAVDPLGRFAYVPINYTQSEVIAQFKIDQATGALVSNGRVAAGGAFAAWIAIDASGKYAYATSGDTGYGSTSIAQYTIDQTTGALTLMSNPSVQAGFGPSEIVTAGK
jgi:6-phosphogluconolactonase (cycloisomerase 2 family)